MLRRISLSALFIITAVFSASAQHWCGTDHYAEKWAAQDPTYEEDRAYADSISSLPLAQKAKSGTVYKIPVVFHVVYASERDNISLAQIKDGLRVLNEDFRKLNSDLNQVRSQFQSDIADIEIEFVLAGKDPQGNCTDGVTRTLSSRAINANNNVKQLVGWDNDRYMNVWLVRSINSGQSNGTILGFSSFPRRNQSITQDGTVMRHDQLGTIGTAVSDGRTLTHETGHYLNLFHPFQGGCSGGDQVNDTPPAASANFGCNFSTNSCNEPNDEKDMIENFMDYADCAYMFTKGQRTRMRNVVTNNTLRGTLVSSSNLMFTGVTNPPTCAPESRIHLERLVSCANDTVKFSETSEEGQPTNWNWSFPGGTPSSSTSSNPEVVYSNPGTYDVTLRTGNSAGDDTVIQKSLVQVKRATPFYNPTYVERFEGDSIHHGLTVDGGIDDEKFEIFAGAASEGSQCLRLRNTQTFLQKDIDQIITPTISATSGNNMNFMFDVAFAATANDNDDVLTVFVSKDCGETWRRKKILRSATLRTAATRTSPFIPNANEWKTITVNLDDFVQSNPIMIKLGFEEGGGNDLYIDYLRFGQGTDIGMEEHNASFDVFNVYPNPVRDGRIQFEALAESTAPYELTITDLSGKQVLTRSYEGGAEGLQTELNVDFNAGVYIVELRSDDRVSRRKLILE